MSHNFLYDLWSFCFSSLAMQVFISVASKSTLEEFGLQRFCSLTAHRAPIIAMLHTCCESFSKHDDLHFRQICLPHRHLSKGHEEVSSLIQMQIELVLSLSLQRRELLPSTLQIKEYLSSLFQIVLLSFTFILTETCRV